MKYESVIQVRGQTPFPEFLGDRHYMVPFMKSERLPGPVSRWQSTVDAMLDGVEPDGPCYLMVDESLVLEGCTQRRPGVHVDGYWNPGLTAHGGSPPYTPGHRPVPTHGPRHMGGVGGWETGLFEEPEAILLASNVEAACGYAGVFDGPIRDGGDCGHIDLSGLHCIPFEAGRVVAGNVTSLHESLPVAKTCLRQLVRINAPGWHPTRH